MSFKIKKWGCGQTVNVLDYYPDASNTCQIVEMSYTGLSFSWMGKIIFLCYDNARGEDLGQWGWGNQPPIWFIYDPYDTSWVGPIDFTLYPQWLFHSYLQGDDREYVYWGADYFMARNGTAGYYYGTDILYGWDRNCNLIDATRPALNHPEPEINVWNRLIFPYDGWGVLADGTPAQLAHCITWGAWNGAPHYETVYAYGLGGGQILRETGEQPFDSTIEFYSGTTEGSAHYEGYPLGNLMVNRVIAGDCGYAQSAYNLYSTPPYVGEECSPLDTVCLAEPHTFSHCPGATYVHLKHRQPDGSFDATYIAEANDPFTVAAFPWSTWEFRAMQEGLSLSLDDHDLDGISHGGGKPYLGQPTYNLSDHLYTALTTANATTAIMYRLDPVQPQGRPVLLSPRGSEAIGWLGDYAIRPNLKVESILPFPDLRAPLGSSIPPQERADGLVLGPTEIYRRRGALTYVRDQIVELSGYPTDDEDWWWPGDWIDPTHYQGFWSIFAGETDVILGRMPDPMWGLLNPLGADISYGLGKPTMQLTAAEPAGSLVLRSTDLIGSTSFAGPITTGTEGRRMLLSSPDGPASLYYYESTVLMTQEPYWNALAGNIVDGSWVTTFNPKAVGFTPPALGQDGWTVWSLVPIKPCRALPKGGYLVGATLYFAPWGAEWGWDAGARDLTFRDSGQGWVPAKAGADGPKTCLDWHAPVLLSAYDEWTQGRSLYGPDALLVFDEHGAFVECLNSFDLYPPDGREIMVTRENNPRIIFRIYRHGTYSDYAEAWGQYHALATDEEIQAPLYACYDLMNASGNIAPGAGTFRGFLDMSAVGRKAAGWRWDTCAPELYDTMYPKNIWAPPGGALVRPGRALSITPLTPGPVSSRNGVRGVGQRSGAQR